MKPVAEGQIVFSDLKSAAGGVIAAKNISCINTDGTGYDNVPLKNRIIVPAGMVQPLWCSLQVPGQAAAGLYTGTAIVKVNGAKERKITLFITVSNNTAFNHGVNDP
ncbi:MAG: hypothetical protein NVSMB7_12350 [Chitinophagaceae bacterium]